MTDIIGLRYVGNGAFRPSLPARDMDLADIATTAAAQKRTAEELAAEAIGSGLYVALLGGGEPEPAPPAEGTPWEGLTKKQLVAVAAERGVEVDPKATNAVLREALIAAAAAEIAAPPVTEEAD